MSDWKCNCWTKPCPHGTMLAHLEATGVLAEVDRMFEEDAAGIVRESITVEEFHALLDASGGSHMKGNTQ